MKFKETGFRVLYRHFCFFESNQNTVDIMKDFPTYKDSNGFLGYCYYDRDAGLTLEILAFARMDKGEIRYAEGNQDVSAKLRIGAVEDLEFQVINDEDGKIIKTFSKKIESLKAYDVSKKIELTREISFLDACRDKSFIDDVRVNLIKTGLKTEECWVRINGVNKTEHFFKGILLNEPYQDFGWHEGDVIRFYVEKTKDNEANCFSIARSINVDKWSTTGGALKPVDLSKVEFVNGPSDQ